MQEPVSAHVESVASALGIAPGLVEKDWYVVQALKILATACIDAGYADAKLVFSGGTSLFKGWGLIQRFSEDIDFKGVMPPGASKTKDRERRKSFRETVLKRLVDSGFEMIEAARGGHDSRFFSADFSYPSVFPVGPGVRPHIKMEVMLKAPARPPVPRSIRSLVALARKVPPEVPDMPCVDPLETAADKLSALAWRVCNRTRGVQGDDPTMVRHLHDLAALEALVSPQQEPEFRRLVLETMHADTSRGSDRVPTDITQRFATMLQRFSEDGQWSTEYNSYVLNMSFAPMDRQISFTDALATVTRLVHKIQGEPIPVSH